MLINEAFEAALQGVASPEAIDLAMRFGVNCPFGPFAWAERIGERTILDVLDGVFAATGDPCCRAFLGLRRAVLHREALGS